MNALDELWSPEPRFRVSTEKLTVRVGDSEERSAGRKAKRDAQAFEVLKALLKKSEGYTDAELVAARIGGTDGPRRRRELRAKFGIDFRATTSNNVTRWSLSDTEHAATVLNVRCAVEKG